MVPSDTREIAVVAIGNPLRGDDGIASQLCNCLPAKLLDTVKIIDLGPYTNLIYDSIKDCSAAIIVDALSGDNRTASHVVLPLDNANSHIAFKSSHGFSFIDELNLRFIGAKNKPAIYLFGITAKDWDSSEDLSETLRQRLPKLRNELTAFIQGLAAHA